MNIITIDFDNLIRFSIVEYAATHGGELPEIIFGKNTFHYIATKNYLPIESVIESPIKTTLFGCEVEVGLFDYGFIFVPRIQK